MAEHDEHHERHAEAETLHHHLNAMEKRIMAAIDTLNAGLDRLGTDVTNLAKTAKDEFATIQSQLAAAGASQALQDAVTAAATRVNGMADAAEAALAAVAPPAPAAAPATPAATT